MNIPTTRWRSLQKLALIIIAIVSLLHFINLETKPYWNDEVYTSLRLSGYTKADVFEFSRSTQQTFGSLKSFQCLNANNNLDDTLTGLITDDVHPPLYFVLVYYWAKLKVCSIANLRLFSSGLSLLVLPSSYLLAYEIFGSLEVALLATVLIASSPIFLIYAQEARQYGLLTFLSLLSSFIMLRIQNDRKNTNFYFYYILVSTAGLYCHTLYQLVIVGQVMYCLFDSLPSHQTIANDSWTGKIKTCFNRSQKIFLSLLISWGLFSIWLVKVVHNNGLNILVGADYTWKDFPLNLLWQRITLNLTSLLYDFEHPVKSSLLVTNSIDRSILNLGWSNISIAILICILLLYAICHTLWHGDRSRISLLGWLAMPSVLFLLKDLILGGSASTIIRYQLLTVSGIYFALAFCLVDLYKQATKRFLKFSIICLIALIIQLQLYSNSVYLAAPTWWNKMGDYQIQNFAKLANESCNPMILLESNPRKMVNLLKISHVLEPSIPFRLVPKQDLSTASSQDSDVVLELRARLPSLNLECSRREGQRIGFSQNWSRVADLNR